MTLALLTLSCGSSSANSEAENNAAGGASSGRGGRSGTIANAGAASVLTSVGGNAATSVGVQGGAAPSNSSGVAASLGGNGSIGGSSSVVNEQGGIGASGGSNSAASKVTGGAPSKAGGSSRGGSGATSGGQGKAGAPLAGGAPSGAGRSSATSASYGGKAAGGTKASGGTDSAGGTAATAGNAATASAALIRNDLFWTDTSGKPIYSQGGGILKVGDTYYWYGAKYNGAVTYAANPTKKNSDTSFAGVTVYSSKDLANWKFENLLTFSNAGDWFGRLGVVYNSTSKKYVLVAQGGGGEFFATSDTPTGDFTFNNIQTSPPGIANDSTGDQTTFQDDDGKAYVICSSASGRSNLYVAPLRAADFLAMEKATRIFGGAGREGNAMFKYNGHYYFCSSDLHGWNASHTYCISASNIMGPYGEEFVLDNTDADFSHVTQTGFFVTVKGTEQSFVIFAGDRWSDFAGNGLGYNQWLPLSFDGTTPKFHSLSEWSIDAVAGTWSVGANNNYALNPSFEADRVDMTQPAGWTTTNSANASGGHSGNWNWTLKGTASLTQKISDLPAGTYTLSAWVKSSGGQSAAQIYATPHGGTQKAVDVNTAVSSWTQKSITGIAVTDGSCEIGVNTSGTTSQSLSVDDFSLVRTGP